MTCRRCATDFDPADLNAVVAHESCPVRPGWHAMMTLCAICSHQWAAVFPNAADFTKLECPRCHAQCSMPVPARDEDDEDPADAWRRS